MPLRDTTWSLGAAIGFLAVFIMALVASTGFSIEARLMPQLIIVGGIAMSAALVAVEIRTRLKGGQRAVASGVVRTAFIAFAWMAGFLVLAGILGYLAALLLIVPAFLMIIARARLRTVIIYTVVLAIAVAVLPSLLPVDLPAGLVGLFS
jgi:putative tricarboxylic transport membrane protein